LNEVAFVRAVHKWSTVAARTGRSNPIWSDRRRAVCLLAFAAFPAMRAKEKSGCFGNFSGKCNLKEIKFSISFYSSKSGGLALYKRNQALLIRGDPATVNKVPGQRHNQQAIDFTNENVSFESRVGGEERKH
jgi:hypothetical protein